jgi:hypothetical protein
MTTTMNTQPADPESAALDLLVDAAETVTGGAAFRPVLQDLAGVLLVEGVLTGLAWADAQLAAAAISYETCTATDPARELRSRAASLRAGYRLRCADPEGIAQALDAAANAVNTL